MAPSPSRGSTASSPLSSIHPLALNSLLYYAGVVTGKPRKPAHPHVSGKGPNKRAGEKGHNVNGFRNQDFTPELKRQYCEALAKTASLVQAAVDLGVHPNTVRKHRKEDPAFDDAVLTALAQFRDMLQATARGRAVDGVVKPIYQRGVRVDKKDNIEYSDGLLIRMLEKHDPEFKSRTSTEATTTNVNINLPAADIESLTTEQRRLLRELITPPQTPQSPASPNDTQQRQSAQSTAIESDA